MAKRGRKTKYKPEFCQKIVDFFDVEPYEDIELPHYTKDGKVDEKGKRILAWMDFKRMPRKLPTLRDFAKDINTSVRAVYDWLDKKSDVFQEKFLHAFMQAKDIRKDFLIQNGLQGLYPPLSFKFVAVNLTDMRDKAEREHGISKESKEFLAGLMDLIDGKSKGLPNKDEIQDS